MTTWKTGRAILAERLAERRCRLRSCRNGSQAAAPMRVQGTAVYLTRDPSLVPHALLLNLQHNKVLHERIVFLGDVHRGAGVRGRSRSRADRARCRLTSTAWPRATGSPRIPRCPACSSGADSRASRSIRRRRRSSSAARRCSRRSGRGWRSGASGCSRASRATLVGRRGTSTFRRVAWCEMGAEIEL